MKNLTLFLYLALIGFLTSLFSSEVPKPKEVKPDMAISAEYELQKNINRLENDKFERNAYVLKLSLDSLKNK